MTNSNHTSPAFDPDKIYVQPDYILQELQKNELTKQCYISDIGCFPEAKAHLRERLSGCEEHILIYCADGEGWLEFDNQPKTTIKPRQLIVIPAGTPHRYGAVNDNPWSIYWMHIQGTHAMELMQTYALTSQPLTFSTNLHQRWIEEIEQCYTLLTEKPYAMASHIYVSQCIRHLISHVGLALTNDNSNSQHAHYFDQAVRYMMTQLDRSLSLTQLADHIGLSKQHLIYMFNQETGTPPIEFYLRLKIQRASQLLALTNLSIKEIANSVGIHDPYYFSRLFKKIMGCSPTYYRNIPKG
ncbi:helix-turn-helix domain-containing protein [Paenibacillus yanchengensis]|uniref:Helix-turn-helix domain-containing protein n=1 Tax=Paenibacillus yanchengensis TaxID=2035833 RepID=A0ABW4YJ27_9BACL